MSLFLSFSTKHYQSGLYLFEEDTKKCTSNVFQLDRILGLKLLLLLGVFFIPYILFMCTCGVPLFFLETALGQYTNQGGITCWRRICPLFQGWHKPTYGALSLIMQCSACVMVIFFNLGFYLFFLFCAGMGYASHLIIAFSATSYIIVIAWAFFYLFFSFSAELPWATCGNDWNTGKMMAVAGEAYVLPLTPPIGRFGPHPLSS